jgi:ornithine carbamoyltransferase
VSTAAAPPRHLLRDDDLDAATQSALLDDAARRKAAPLDDRTSLGGRSVALVFEKHSTRTRTSFEAGVAALGGHPITLDPTSSQLGRGETLEDTARVLSRYCAAIVWRTSGHERLTAVASEAAVPVVNALSDDFHPCQALADLLTLRECFGDLRGRVLSYLGDGNNVASSLLLAGAIAGLHVRVGAPERFAPDAGVVRRAAELAAVAGGSVLVTTDAAEAADGADALYTDVWTSMGQEAQAQERRRAFEGFTVGEAMFAGADGAVFLHCLPAHRGEEVAAEVIDGPRSRVWPQAENRLHAARGLLAWLFGAG